MNTNWDMQHDVIVIGGGGAGLAAALEASNHGADVVLIEKCPQLGGTTSIAVGSITAACTSMQKAAGIEDRPDWHNEDIGKFNPALEDRNDFELRGFFTQHAAETFEWLREMGLQFQGPNPEPPNRMPRMHNVVPNAKAYIAAMHQRLIQNKVKILFSCTAKRLVQDNDERVIGIEVEHDGKPLIIQAKKGVILASGDYSNSESVKLNYLSDDVAQVEGINPNSTGDGHQLAQQAGAELVNMDVVYGPELRFVPPPHPPFSQLLPTNPFLAKIYALGMKLLPHSFYIHIVKKLLVTWQHPENTLFQHGAVLINQKGERFVDETGNPELAIPRQPGKYAYIVFDNRIAELFSEWPHFISTAPEIAYAYVKDYKRLRPDIYTEAETWDGLAQKLNVSANKLSGAIQTHNNETSLEPLNNPPYYALGPVKSWIVTTEGGVRINQDMQALKPGGSPIPGLYATGSTGNSGMIIWGHGLHIAWAFTSGRLAGKHISKNE